MSSIPNCSFADIHSHIVYGLDDGAQSPEDSIAMLEIAIAGGTTDIVATPHCDMRFSYQPDAIAERIGELTRATGGRIRIHPGCDFHLSFDNIQDCLANPTKYTINHKRYLMVEFADILIPTTSSEVFQRMIDADITPVITHPERNPLLQVRLAQLADWVRMGCLIQVTAQSFQDRFGKRCRAATEKLMDRGLVHFVASDAHDALDRTPLLSDAYALVVDRYGAAKADALFSANPRAAIEGRYLEAADPVRGRKRRWFW